MFEIINIDELINRLNGYSHKELHVHHTWAPSHKDFNGSNGIALQEAMKRYHVDNLDWSDIGQHVTLLPDGLFVTGRDFGRAPASIAGYNVGAFAMEMLGNFDNGNDAFQGEQKNSALRVAKYFIDKSRYVRFHRENSSKTCPGTSIDKDSFMNEAKSFRAAPVEISKPVEVVKGNSRVKLIQELCNVLRCTDYEGKALIVDGILGGRTLSAVEKLPTIRINTNCDQAARVIQEIVGARVDGAFGVKTLAAVKAYQSANGLVADGIVGQKTWHKFLEV